MIKPINQLSVGSIAKIPSLPNINNVTVLHINFSGVRVKGSETLNDKTTNFDHIISGQTPVEQIGFNEEVAKNHSDKEALKEFNNTQARKTEIANISESNQNNSSNTVDESEKTDKVEQSNNNSTQKNNMSDENTETQNTTPVVQETQEVTNQTFVAPSAQFSAKEFAAANKLEYPNALAYLKLNAKEVGKRSAGRGRPTILYSLV